LKILIIKLSSIGDLFHALPAAHNLKVELSAEVHWVTQKENVKLVECFDDVSNVILFPRKETLKGLKAFIKGLRTEEYDYIIDLQGLMKSAFVARLAKGKNRIGPSFQREGAFLFYNNVAGKRNKERHAVNECYDVIDFLKLNRIEPTYNITFPKYELPKSSSPKIAIAPVSRWETKNWFPEQFAETAKILIEKLNASIFLLGAPGDKDVCDKINNLLDGKANNLAGKTSLTESGSVLEQMDILISNDSGPVHIACALNLRNYVIFGPTSALRTGPFGDNNFVFQADLDCIPCYKRVCKFGDKRCMKAVTPKMVADKITTDFKD
jgi:lipopolysaccharide heptosyltransferase II